MAWLPLTLACVAGCLSQREEIGKLHQELAAVRSQNRLLQATVDAQAGDIETLKRGLDNFERLGDTRIDKLYRAERVEIGRMSGGRDYNGEPGDDGVTLYLHLFDQDGHRFKAAGEIEVQVFDLEGDEPGELIAEYRFSVNASKVLWYGQALTYHYKITCPWIERPPRGRAVTARVTFLDYLTGRPLVDTAQLEVHPPVPLVDAPAGEPSPAEDR